MAKTLTVLQFAWIVGRSPGTIKILCRRGTLHAEKVGRDWHIQAEEVDRYRAEMKRRKAGEK